VFAFYLETPMDRTIVFSALLLVGLTWLLYKLTLLLEPRGDRPAPVSKDADKNASSSCQKPIHQRLRN
jgi:hypothetical protein